jgi:hypothetical protein
MQATQLARRLTGTARTTHEYGSYDHPTSSISTPTGEYFIDLVIPDAECGNGCRMKIMTLLCAGYPKQAAPRPLHAARSATRETCRHANNKNPALPPTQKPNRNHRRSAMACSRCGRYGWSLFEADRQVSRSDSETPVRQSAPRQARVNSRSAHVYCLLNLASTSDSSDRA